MTFLSRAREALIRRSFRRIADQLAAADAETLLAGTELRVLRVFREAAKTVPKYRALLERARTSPEKIVSLEGFREHVPVIDKRTWFDSDLRDVCTGGTLNGIASFYSSSGQTGFFSYGGETRQEQKQAALSLEFSLQQAFHVLDRKTLLINCLPMGVRVHTRSLSLAETSVREDVVWSLLRKLGKEFDQFILLGEHPFLKHVVEGGSEQPAPIDWKALCIQVITGGEYIAENFRSYLASQLGLNVEEKGAGSILVNYGLSELSVSIANENWHTVQIRRFAHTDTRFRQALCGSDDAFCPTVMQYYPTQVYLETLPSSGTRQELIATMLDLDRRIPMIRYNTGDCALLVTHAKMVTLLRDFGRADLIPPLALPAVLIWGKSNGLPTAEGTVSWLKTSCIFLQ